MYVIRVTEYEYLIRVTGFSTSPGVLSGFTAVYFSRKIAVKDGVVWLGRRARARVARARMFVTSRVLFRPTQQYEI
jgi:hypothetical protein